MSKNLKLVNVGEGTTFRVLLPKSDRHPEIHPKAQKGVKDLKRSGTILLIDDEEEIASVTKMMLEFNGFSVLTAMDGQKGVELFSKHVDKINLVLMDLTMPNMNGEEAFREMKQIRNDVRVILVSGHNEEEIKNRFYGEGFAGFFYKPYGMPDLMDKIQEALT
ncbi:MAG: response regulator [Deltaproteobacteria bacterium]|nr:response regulator [Deltaproteobacteria bacterium]